MKTMVGSVESPGDTSRDAGALDDPKLGQLVQFQMAESFPWANHCDICKTERIRNGFWSWHFLDVFCMNRKAALVRKHSNVGRTRKMRTHLKIKWADELFTFGATYQTQPGHWICSCAIFLCEQDYGLFSI